MENLKFIEEHFMVAATHRRTKIVCENIQEIYRKNFGEQCDVVVDLGANVGIYTCYLSHLFPNASVFSFEPEIENFQYLLKHVSINCISKNVHTFNVAICDVENECTKEMFMNEGRKENTGLYTFKQMNGFKKFQEVKVTNLKSYSNYFNKIDVLKIDVEGSEREILKSNLELFSTVKVIFSEHNSSFDPNDELSELLKGINFSIVNKHRNDYVWIKNV